MKKLLIVLLAVVTMVPWNVFALEESYETKNLKDTLAAEKIEADLSKYKETDDQITIYMFRGDGCGYCQRFLTFLGSIVPDYGKYFKLVSYEVWYDKTKKNSQLMEDISDFLGEAAEGVPYVIIGDQVFPGYISSYDESIKSAIKKEYDKSTRYDVMKEYKKYLEEKKDTDTDTDTDTDDSSSDGAENDVTSSTTYKKEDSSTGKIVIFQFVFLVIATFILACLNIANTNKLEEKIGELKSELEKVKEELERDKK